MRKHANLLLIALTAIGSFILFQNPATKNYLSTGNLPFTDHHGRTEYVSTSIWFSYVFKETSEALSIIGRNEKSCDTVITHCETVSISPLLLAVKADFNASLLASFNRTPDTLNFFSLLTNEHKKNLKSLYSDNSNIHILNRVVGDPLSPKCSPDLLEYNDKVSKREILLLKNKRPDLFNELERKYQQLRSLQFDVGKELMANLQVFADILDPDFSLNIFKGDNPFKDDNPYCKLKTKINQLNREYNSTIDGAIKDWSSNVIVGNSNIKKNSITTTIHIPSFQQVAHNKTKLDVMCLMVEGACQFPDVKAVLGIYATNANALRYEIDKRLVSINDSNDVLFIESSEKPVSIIINSYYELLKGKGYIGTLVVVPLLILDYQYITTALAYDTDSVVLEIPLDYTVWEYVINGIELLNEQVGSSLALIANLLFVGFCLLFLIKGNYKGLYLYIKSKVT